MSAKTRRHQLNRERGLPRGRRPGIAPGRFLWIKSREIKKTGLPLYNTLRYDYSNIVTEPDIVRQWKMGFPEVPGEGTGTNVLYLFAFLGGLALFLYGMELMGNGLQQAAGAKLQKILRSLTGLAVMGVALGALVTAILQSSSATTVMTVGLVNAGLLTLKQAFGVIMGANIGTTVTAQLIAFKLTDYFTLMLFIGLMLQIFSPRKKGRYCGQVLLGFGILMLGMKMMGDAVMPLHHYPGFVEFISRFASQPMLAVVVGLVMTVVIQSSAATIGILMAMAGQGLIPLEGAVPVLLGDNIGTCITAILAAARANITARKVALSHVLFNLFGCIIFIIFMPLFIKLVLAISPADDIGRQIANAHSAFNVLNTIIFLPLVGPFIKLVEKIMPAKEEVVSLRPLYLDDNMIGTPSIALVLAEKEVIRLSQQARLNLETALSALQEYDKEKVEYVLKHEPVVDYLNEQITEYLTKVSGSQLSPELSAKHTALMHACTDLERIGDHAQTLAKRARKIREENIVFSPAAVEEIANLAKMTLTACGVAMDSLADNDTKKAQEAWTDCRKVKSYQKELRKHHIMRLTEGSCNPGSGFMFLELLLNMKRVSDHSKNVAQLVLGIF